MSIRTARRSRSALLSGLALVFLVLACAVSGPRGIAQHRWWNGFGPVLPHDGFPADCGLCHVGEGWWELVPDFQFDHARETGLPLEGAHSSAQCLRCHNDRGPVEVFASQGCAGCHENVHLRQIGFGCETCHQQTNWRPTGQVELHQRTRFPLVGVHTTVSCRRCHPGAEVGRFRPTDTECVTCHTDDLAAAVNPNHIALGWVNRCDRCHQPTTWNQAEL